MSDENIPEDQDTPAKAEKLKKNKIYASDLDYIRDAKSALIANAPSRIRAGLLLMLLVIIFAFAWAYNSDIDEVINANGKVVPSMKLQVVQHLEGGIIKEIMVGEGEKVTDGEVLVKLDSTRWRAEYTRDQAKAAVLDAEVSRLEAEVNGLDKPVFSADLKKQYPALVKNATTLFDSRKEALDEKVETLQRNYQLTKEELDIIRPLAAEGVMSKVDLLRLERQLTVIEGEMKEAIDEARNESSDRLNSVRSDKQLLVESSKAGLDRMQRTEIRSRINGTINQIYISSKGEVIRPGQRILDIVPDGDSTLSIQARIKPDQIGFIKPGQKVVVKVTAFDFSRFGGIIAKVDSISADSLTDDGGNLYYEVKMVAPLTTISSKDKKLLITPGMTVNANIIVGKKSVLEYMLKPFLKARDEAFKEG